MTCEFSRSITLKDKVTSLSHLQEMYAHQLQSTLQKMPQWVVFLFLICKLNLKNRWHETCSAGKMM